MDGEGGGAGGEEHGRGGEGGRGRGWGDPLDKWSMLAGLRIGLGLGQGRSSTGFISIS